MNRVYVAGPYTRGDVAVNVRKAIDAADELLGLGYAPFLPHLSHFWHLCHQRPWEDWMRLDLAWLPKCDAVLRLPGESAGADREVDAAHVLGIPCFTEIAALRRVLPPATRRKEGTDA
jgi:hypothetical protein